MKLLTVIGARPQFIKASVLSSKIIDFNNYHNDKITEIIVHTGQHYDKNMSDIFFNELKLPKPKYNLNINNNSHAEMTGKMSFMLEKILIKENPDWVVLYGDTNSTLAGAISASKLKMNIAHIEAGLRSNNLFMPEEINRALTDRVSTLLFCPTKSALKNLKDEGYPLKFTNSITQKIFNVGDVMYDVALKFKNYIYSNFHLSRWDLEKKKYVLCTIHRSENTDNIKKLKSILSAINKINKKIKVVFPLHPRTLNIIISNKMDHLLIDLKILEPLSYFEMQRLALDAYKIFTDSGGLQKEAYFYDIPCITLRDETEWVETLIGNYNVLSGANEKKILDSFLNQNPSGKKINHYGDGDAAKKILDILKSH